MNDSENNPVDGLFSHTDDFIKLTETARKFPSINEIKLKDFEHYGSLIKQTNNDPDIIPIFLKSPNGSLEILSSFNQEVPEVQEGSKLVYMGKPFDIEETD